MVRFLKFFITLCVMALFFWFVLFNHSSIDVVFPPFAGSISIPLGFILLAVLVGGFIWGSIIVALHYTPLRCELRRLMRANKKLEENLLGNDKNNRVAL